MPPLLPSLPNTGDKLRSSILARLRQLQSLVDPVADPAERSEKSSVVEVALEVPVGGFRMDVKVLWPACLYVGSL
jgi:hypothetical protein